MKKRRTIVKSSPTRMTSEEDIRRLPADWNRVPARTKTQVSAKQPAYRCQGEFFIAGEMPLSIQYRHENRSEAPYFNASFLGCFARTQGNHRRWHDTLERMLAEC